MKKTLLVSVLVLALMMVSMGCESKADEAKTDEEMINDTMNGFFDAVNKRNVQKASNFFAGASQMSQQDEEALTRVVEAWCSAARSGKISLKNIEDVNITGSMATATIVISLGDVEAPPQEFEFKKEDDAWKITSTIPCSSLGTRLWKPAGA